MVDDICYRIDTPRVVHEAIKDEVIMIDFESGNYYSLEGSGSLIWDLIVQGASRTTILAHVRAHYDIDGADLEASVDAFLNDLLGENLIFAVDAALPASTVEGWNGAGQSQGRLSWQQPVLQRYTDMRELLLLDPIHEVDETGWPNRPSEVA